jgi:AAT family amino acid transporter
LPGIATALFVVAFAFGGTEIVSVAAAETAEPARSVKKAVRTVLWRILVFYLGAIFIIAAVVPVGSEGLKSSFAAVLEAAGMPGAGTAITLVAVATLLSAGNANLHGASRMAYSLAERGEAPRLLASVSKARVPVVAVLARLALRLRADREGTEPPLRMPGFPWLACLGLLIIAAIFTVGLIGEDSRPQLHICARGGSGSGELAAPPFRQGCAGC